MGKRKLDRRARQLLCEQLESRCVLSAIAGGSDFHADIVAGDPNGSPADSPTDRIDVNSTSSPFAGVGSLQISANRGTYICTATPIDSTHVLTAGHCVDLNNDGKSDKRDGIRGITFNLNYGGNLTSQIPADHWNVNPNFTGFNRPSINDDLTVITLKNPLPAGVPIYALPTSDLAAGTTLYLVGYGRSGDGISGYTTDASWTVKRQGENNADAFYTQDDAGQPAANEVFRFDFDGPTGNGSFGGPTLGNDLETTLGGGDSGGPSFVLSGSSYTLVGVNTFTQGTNAPKFGSLGGGINVFPYLSWINSVLTSSAIGGGAGPGNGAGGQSVSAFSAMDAAILVAPAADSDSGSVQMVESQGNAGVTATVGSPAAQSAIVVDAGTEESQGTGLLHSTRDKFAGDSDDLLAIAEDTTGVADDAETDEFAPAVDEILRRWSV